VAAVSGDVADLAAERRKRHEPSPRPGEGYYRHSALRGYNGQSEPSRSDYPLTTICAGCGKTIRRESPEEEEWGHVTW
jgi:hypothetical protein